MFMGGSSRHGDVNDVIYDAMPAWEGRYGCTRGLIWVQVRADMGSHERAIMGLETQAVSARVYKQFVTNTCNKV